MMIKSVIVVAVVAAAAAAAAAAAKTAAARVSSCWCVSFATFEAPRPQKRAHLLLLLLLPPPPLLLHLPSRPQLVRASSLMSLNRACRLNERLPIGFESFCFCCANLAKPIRLKPLLPPGVRAPPSSPRAGSLAGDLARAASSRLDLGASSACLVAVVF